MDSIAFWLPLLFLFVSTFVALASTSFILDGVAASAIVVTAVYVLRAIGILLLGPITNPEHEKLDDARWYEKVSIITLVVAILIVGIAPLWLSDMIQDSLTPIVEKLQLAVK